MQGAMDFSVLRSPIVSVIILYQIYLVVSYIRGELVLKVSNTFDYLNYAIKLVVSAFVLQSFIQIVAFLNDEFLHFVRYFQHQSDAEMLSEGYGRLRGLALSSELTFSLAAGYGLAFIFFAVYANAFEKKTLSKAIYYLALVIGAMFAGRTAFVGLFIGYCLHLHIAAVKKKNFFKQLFASIFLITLAVLFLENSPDEVRPLLSFAFEFYYAYRDTGSVSTESTDILFNKHLSVLSDVGLPTLMFGDGLYTNYDGTYYKNTDSGYVRNILFGGLFFVALKFFSQAALNFGWVLNGDKNIQRSKLFLLNLYTFAYLIILHIKGDAILNLKICILMIFFVNAMACTKIVKPTVLRRD